MSVFLAFESDDYFAAYPTPKLADFGMAVETETRDQNNPRHIAYVGTRGYHAPVSLFCLLRS